MTYNIGDSVTIAKGNETGRNATIEDKRGYPWTYYSVKYEDGTTDKIATSSIVHKITRTGV